MESLVKTEYVAQENVSLALNVENDTLNAGEGGEPIVSPQNQQQQQPPLKTKRKHRRGKPKAKNANKPYKKSNWKFQVPRPNFNGGGGGGGVGGGGGGGGGGMNHRNGARAKLVRSRSLVPYNTNKFLMEEHLAEVPSALLTPSGRTRDSSFSVDSEDNYFFSLPEDEEEFLTKEFANVYEKARVERLENLTKQQLIEECLQIEDRYSSDQGRQQQLNVQRITAEFMSKVRVLEEKVRELSRENYNLRCQLMRSAAMAAAAAAAASPPSAAPPTGAACEPTPMDSSSVDSESDSSSSSSSSSSNGNGSGAERNNLRLARRISCSSHSSLSEYNAFNDNDCMDNEDEVDANNGKVDASNADCEPFQRPEPNEYETVNGDGVGEGGTDGNETAVRNVEIKVNEQPSNIVNEVIRDEFSLGSPAFGGVDTDTASNETQHDNVTDADNVPRRNCN